MPVKPNRLNKKSFLKHFASLKRKRELKPTPVRYKHKGSTYDQDGIRINGSQEFIDSVLSRLTDLLQFENTETRLQVNYTQATDKNNGNVPIDSWVCYIQVHERGDEAKMANALASAITGKSTILSRGY